MIGAAPLLGELLAAAPGLTMIVTSRATLRLAGEQEYPVQPLAEAPASTLFVQRAAAVSPEFALTDENAEPIAAICSRLEGLPLAIELAAARTKLLTPAALLARLSSRLEVLTAGTRDAPERHQTMRAAIDWSYRLLDPAGQELFDELAVFVGGASLDAIEAVCGGDVFETLASLVDNSLVYRGHEAEPRFRMLDVIREYALEQLAARNETGVRTRHAAYYLALAREAETELEGAHQQQWLERLELEHPNLRAALDFALESGDELGALRGAIGLRRFWLLRGHLAQGRQRLEAVAALGVGDAAERAAVLNGLGFLAGEQGDFDASADYFEQSLVLAREAGIPRRIAAPLANLGNLAVWRGDVERAIELYGEVARAAPGGEGRASHGAHAPEPRPRLLDPRRPGAGDRGARREPRDRAADQPHASDRVDALHDRPRLRAGRRARAGTGGRSTRPWSSTGSSATGRGLPTASR